MFARGFLGVLPTKLVQALVQIARPQEWPAIYIACSGTFRIERGLLSALQRPLELHSNDVSLFSSAIGRAAIGAPLSFAWREELGFINDLEEREERMRAPAVRIASQLVAVDYARYLRGEQTRWKREHAAHYRSNFQEYAIDLGDKIRVVLEALGIASYQAGDMRDHVDRAIAAGAGAILYPPVVKGSYEKSFAFLDANTDWQRPDYPIFDPEADLAPMVEKLERSAVPYFVFAEQELAKVTPVLRFEAPGKGTVFGYGRTSQSSFRRPISHAKPFAYKRVDLRRITATSKLWLAPCIEPHAFFMREVFLARGILYGSADFSVKVMIDDMLAGLISYRRPIGDEALFVLTDMSTTREGRIAKLVARLATCHDAFRPFEHRLIVRFNRLATTVMSPFPDSMKYRGSWTIDRREGDDGAYILHYVSPSRDETPQSCFAWWWKRDGQKAVAAVAIRDSTGQAAGSEAA